LPKTTIILADSALELIPEEIHNNHHIKNYCKKQKKNPTQILLDSSYHYKAMRELVDFKRRGRPDIIHFSLISILGTPLLKNQCKNVRIIIHTYDKKMIEINPQTRIPRNYNRFKGLIEDLFEKNQIIADKLELMSIINNSSLENELRNTPKNQIILFTSKGTLVNFREYINSLANLDLAFIVGGFPYGSFSDTINHLSDNKIAIKYGSFDAWTVISRIIYDREYSIKV